MKKLLIVSVLMIGSACSANEIKASLPDGFIEVTEDDVQGNTAIIIKHKETGCHFISVNGGYDTTVGITQMFIEKNGVSVPYCD